MPSCPRCGAQQAERSAFCSACGALIDRPDTAAPPPIQSGPPAAEQSFPLPGETSVGPSPLPRPAVRHDFGDIGIYIVRRFLALVVDLVGAGFLIAIGLIAYVDATNAAPDTFLALHLRDFAIALAGGILVYLTLAEWLFGSTIGKGLFGLGVGRAAGGRLGLPRALVRNIVLPVDLAVIGFLIATVTASRRRLGDLIAGSVVTNARIGGLATVVSAAVCLGATWLLFANADGARMSSQLFALAGLQMPAGRYAPSPTPSPLPSVVQPVPLPAASTVQPRPKVSPSADPGRPVPI